MSDGRSSGRVPSGLTRGRTAGALRWALLILNVITPFAGAQANESVLRAASVEVREVPEGFSADGVVQALKQSTIAAQVAGRIVDMSVDVGSLVKRGQAVAKVDERDAADMLAGAKAQVEAANAAFLNASSSLERTQQLYKKGFLSAAALDKAKSEYRTAEAQLQASRAGAGQARTAKSFTLILSPIDGVVSARHAELGEMAMLGRPILTVFEPKGLRVEATVPQSIVSQIRPGSPTQIELTNGATLNSGAITVVPAADARSHTSRVRVDIREAPPSVTPGEYARVRFITGTSRKLVIPTTALVHRSELTAAYVIGEGGSLELRQLRTGDRLPGGATEVLSGVSAGERVALEPNQAAVYLKQSALK